ncbi:hypothetical protein [Eubacterium xylanophilum]|uniref:hypothetical protein n=1 Tax=Eubacterium xylanophilum TaxID=39497 RepID=UPI0004AE53E6
MTKKRIKTIIAFSLLVIVVTVGFSLSILDSRKDVCPDENTNIRLYGESHGVKEFYDIEFGLWKEYYDEGYRALFVELPYFTAEFLNLWMQEDSDEIIDQLFEEIQGTQSGNEYYYEFFHEIKEQCPQTVFYGTDVGHQYDTTGARYLEYLDVNGLAESENYRLAKRCIDQGIAYRSDDSNHDGISVIRESYMVSNFTDAYSRCGTDKIMGIYGSYHTDLDNPNLMAGRLKSYYGDILSSVRISTLVFRENRPYRLGFCITGFVFLLMLFIPNIYWGVKAKPEGYDEAAKKENKLLLLFERAGEVSVSYSLLIFPALNPYIKLLPQRVFYEDKIIMCFTAFVLMILYECYWIKYFRSERTLKNQYSSFAGFPVAGATLPVIAVLFLGLYSMNLVVIVSGVILGIGHIGIHLMHYKEIT